MVQRLSHRPAAPHRLLVNVRAAEAAALGLARNLRQAGL